jgi:hypothetical protein
MQNVAKVALPSKSTPLPQVAFLALAGRCLAARRHAAEPSAKKAVSSHQFLRRQP